MSELEPRDMPNLPADHPLRGFGVCTDIDLMIAMGINKKSFDDYHKPHLRSRACNGKWSLIDAAHAAEYIKGLMKGPGE